MSRAITIQRRYEPDERAMDELVRGLLARLTPTQEKGPGVETAQADAPEANLSQKAPLRVEDNSERSEGQAILKN